MTRLLFLRPGKVTTMALWLRIALGSIGLLLAVAVYYFWIYRPTRNDKGNSALRK